MRPSVERSCSISHPFLFVNTFFEISSTFFEVFLKFLKMICFRANNDLKTTIILCLKGFLRRNSFLYLIKSDVFCDFFFKNFQNLSKIFFKKRTAKPKFRCSCHGTITKSSYNFREHCKRSPTPRFLFSSIQRRFCRKAWARSPSQNPIPKAWA